ncbi:MAG: hypothetical protein CL840_11490 [Crocinitomicaceae bacterium]|nr:hypothetical protein [Crocinitomicaceae bacterium]|tara:strand:- start:8745 stop:9269 length:525 start_codon:yes stop_codon:yes gene_type:complete
MNFELSDSIEILERTPIVLKSYLSGLSDNWLRNNEGKDTWSPYDVLGHLIFGEKTDWMVRIKIILNDSEDKLFGPFDRFAQLQEDQDKSIEEMLENFSELRHSNLEELKALNITPKEFSLTGIHPEFGTVRLDQLIATWVAHDLGHVGQISRVMAKQYKDEAGPWIKYLRVLNQ